VPPNERRNSEQEGNPELVAEHGYAVACVLVESLVSAMGHTLTMTVVCRPLQRGRWSFGRGSGMPVLMIYHDDLTWLWRVNDILQWRLDTSARLTVLLPMLQVVMHLGVHGVSSFQ
jgi:hypothetical protein